MGYESYGGQAIFGAAVSIQHLPQASAQQVDSFFGITGNLSLAGGGRGRMFDVEGVLIGTSPADVLSAETLFLSYADQIARTLVDPIGRSWDNVIFKGEYQPNKRGMYPTDFGWCLPYKAVFHGLT
jgi:hypothetical protein